METKSETVQKAVRISVEIDSVVEAYVENIIARDYIAAIESARKLASIGTKEERKARARWRNGFLSAVGRAKLDPEEAEAIANPDKPISIGSDLLWGKATSAKGLVTEEPDCIRARMRKGVSYTSPVPYVRRDVSPTSAVRNAILYLFPGRFGKGEIVLPAETENETETETEGTSAAV